MESQNFQFTQKNKQEKLTEYQRKIRHLQQSGFII